MIFSFEFVLIFPDSNDANSFWCFGFLNPDTFIPDYDCCDEFSIAILLIPAIFARHRSAPIR